MGDHGTNHVRQTPAANEPRAHDGDPGSQPGSTLHGRPVWPDEATVFAAEGVTAEQVGRYPPELLAVTVPALIHAGVEPDEAARWVEHGARSGDAIVELKRAGFAPEDLDRWPERLTDAEVVQLHRAGIGPEGADPWSERWYGRDIIHLTEQRIRPDEADAYPEWLPARWVERFWWLDIDGDAAHDLVGEPDEPVDPYDRMSTISQADTERLAAIWRREKDRVVTAPDDGPPPDPTGGR